MEARSQLETLERLVFDESLPDEREHRHLSRRPIDEVLSLGGQVQVLDVAAFRADFQKSLFSLIDKLAHHLDPFQPLAPLEEAQLDENVHAEHLTTELADQLGRGGGRASGGQHIIHDQHCLAGSHRVLVDLKLVGSILELVVLADGLPRQLTRLADRHEPGPEPQSHGAAGDEPSRLDRSDHVGWAVQPVAAHFLDHAFEHDLVRQQGGDVLENDPRLREVWDVANQPAQVLFGQIHTTPRKYSRVRARPSSSATSGCQPRSLRAWAMSGRRCLGSSIGRGRSSMALEDPASRMMISASSRTVTSFGLPRLTGSSSPLSSVASTPRTRSDT